MSRETYISTVVRHKLEKEYFADGSRLETCTVCTLIQSYEPGEGFAVIDEGNDLVCTVEVQKCICEKSHTRGHSKCVEAGEHVCSPCECDCHYED